MVNVECFIVFCSSRLGRFLVISIRRFAKVYPPICEGLSADLRKPIRRFAKAYLPICEKRCKVISFSPYNDAVATHFNFASDRTRCLLAFYNNCVIAPLIQRLQFVTITLFPHPSTSLSPSHSPFFPIPSAPLFPPPSPNKQRISLPSIRGGAEQPIGLRGGGASFPPSLSLFITLLTPLHRK